VSAPGPGTIIDDYRIVRRIASGGMATIFEAQDSASQKVALKIPHESFKQDRGALKRLMIEARAAMAIDSPHVVRTLSVGKLDSGMPYLVMEFVDGTPLRDLMYDTQARPQPLALETTLTIVDQICAGVAAAHAVEVIHRDLKPDNVLLAFGHQGVMAKVFDFGLSRMSAELSISRLTGPGTTFGTPQYMAPEQARSASSVDQRVDVYAIGVITYEMLAARFPFDGDTPLEVWRKATRGNAVSLGQHRPDLPEALVSAVMRALAREPAARFSSVQELRAALASSRTVPVDALELPRAAPGRPALPKVNLLVVGAACFAVLLSAVVIVMLALWYR
jgi:serine/threonine-protein kinase